ncbi:MAG: phosphatase PAP2 family protein [Solirubrobacterales bacterium]
MATTEEDLREEGPLARLHRLDVAAYEAMTAHHSPRLDRALAAISEAANLSKPWNATAALLARAGGPRGRRAALHGIGSVAVASAVVNLALKPLWPRTRPDRSAVHPGRHVPMPTSTSFPSGHSASAVAFATGVGSVMPVAGALLALPAATVAYSRIHTGVHYPGDVLVGSLTGFVLARAASAALSRLGL